MTEDIVRPFEEKMVSSALLEIPRNTYQRNLNSERVKRISHSFDENSKVTMDIYAKIKYNKPEELSGVVNDALKK